MHLHVAGDFIVMASTYAYKSETVTPRPEFDDDGEIIDPRTELVNQLVDYKRYKNAAEVLNNLSNDQGQKFTEQLEPLIFGDELDVEENLILDVTLFDLAILKSVWIVCQ